MNVGVEMHDWAKKLWPICRSITGEGLRETLGFIRTLCPSLVVHEVLSGTQVFDWRVPQEWRIKEAYIIDPENKKILDFKQNNLHVVGYSTSIDKTLDLSELQLNLHSLPDQPPAIPYVTSYYQKNWGFCLSENQRKELKPGKYRVFIDADHFDGRLNYGELFFPGRSRKEVLFSTYVCHPSMANNELSGPVVASALARFVSEVKDRKYSYRFLFLPETIGSIAFLSKNLKELKKNLIAGFVVTCIGDERQYSYLPSRTGNTYADQVAKRALSKLGLSYVTYSFNERGSDERQYCSPRVNLPVCSLMRSKYHTYPEYHTSLDDLMLVTPKGLEGGLRLLQQVVDEIETDVFPVSNTFCEPQLGKRGLYSNLSMKGSYANSRDLLNSIAYSDGYTALRDIAKTINLSEYKTNEVFKILLEHDLVKICDVPASALTENY